MQDSTLIELLKENIMTVEFTKKDGTDRVMLCTLNENVIPLEKQPKNPQQDKTTDAPAEAQRVFDVEKNEWRSFRWDGLKQYQVKF
jgi:hypothetical protein